MSELDRGRLWIELYGTKPPSVLRGQIEWRFTREVGSSMGIVCKRRLGSGLGEGRRGTFGALKGAKSLEAGIWKVGEKTSVGRGVFRVVRDDALSMHETADVA